MKYFIDTEFVEGQQKTLFGKTKPTIDLISIGIVCEDGREYYAISKDFNLKEAWNRYDLKKDFGKPQGLGDIKKYWLRENEAKAIKDRGGIIIRVNREDITGQYKLNPHTSETALDDYNFDYVIDNFGTIEELIAKVRVILTNINIL